jgi:K+:H+ antiporter
MMPEQTVLKGLEHHALFLLLLQLCILLFATRLLGEVMKKLGQPAVVGELAAGVLLGPSVFGIVWPELQIAIFPRSQTQADLLAVISWIGVLFLLIVTGLETDLRLIREKGRTALLISTGGIIIPFVSGFVLGQLLPDRFLVSPEQRSVFSLFMAVAMSISAVPVIAKVLFDLKLTRRDIGQLTLAAAMTDDTIGWILLSVVAGLASRGTVDVLSIGVAAGSALLFLLFSFTIGGKIVELILLGVDEVAGSTGIQLSTVLVVAFAASALTHELGIEAVLGAFVTGILAGQARRFKAEVRHALELITVGFVAPIFFASAGLKVDLVRMIEPDVMTAGAIVLAIACLGKFVGCYLGAWAGGLPHWERLAMGAGMNARGAMEIIVATVGLALRVLTPEMYSVIVMIAIVTSLMAPPLLRFTLSRIEIGEAERTRLENEAIAASSFVRSIRRVLLIAKDVEQAELGGGLVEHLHKAQRVEVTAVYVDADRAPMPWWGLFARQPREAWLSFRDTLTNIRRVMRRLKATGVKIAMGRDAVETVLREAGQGYDLITMAVGRGSNKGELLFGGVVDRVIQEAPCATLVLRAGNGLGEPRPNEGPPSIQRILVPTIGTEYSKNALEAASVLAKSAGAEVTVLHVLGRPASHIGQDVVSRERAKEIAHEVVDHQAAIARKFGADVKGLVLEGTSPESAILDLLRDEKFDLIVMGTSLRTIGTRAFLGHRAETLLKNAPCAVAVVSTR